jgi:hypothetical protein
MTASPSYVPVAKLGMSKVYSSPLSFSHFTMAANSS